MTGQTRATLGSYDNAQVNPPSGPTEIQGDKREEVHRILVKANFKPVFAEG